jgi:glycosyltransferase involved in cell wall biosynthesis
MIDARGKGVFVVDEMGSPLWRVANSHALKSGDRVFIANQFFSVSAMIREILRTPTSYLIFTWRGAFDSVLQSEHARQMLRKGQVSIFLLIPDLIGIHQRSKVEQSRINSADGLIVTSEELLNCYKEVYELKSIQILHDLPPIDALKKMASCGVFRNSRKIIWVGNSKWGERAGFVDHKGLRTFALPVFHEVKKKFGDLTLTVIDSASGKIAYENVLHEIASSSCLIFTSNSEGTGLPMIEAAALGTPLVSFKVGIAPELLRGNLTKLISPKDIEQFADKVSHVLNNYEEISREIVKASDVYIARILGDFERLKLNSMEAGSWRVKRQTRKNFNILKWKYRWGRYFWSMVCAK